MEKVLTLRTYIMKRLVISIFILWVIATINYVIFRGDPMAVIHEWEWQYIDPTTKEILLESFGANLGTFLRYLWYLRTMFTYGLVRPYFGYSRLAADFIAPGLSQRLPITLFLMGTAFMGSVIFGIVMGMLAASRQGSKRDAVITTSSLFTWAMPIFLIQFLAIWILTYLFINYGIHPFSLVAAIDVQELTHLSGLQLYATIAWHMTLPIITLMLAGLGPWVIRTRNMLVDTLTQDYIVTARAKGLSERTIMFKHAFKSILPPVATMITLATPTLISGSIITETIFGINGIGNYFLRAFIVEGQIVRVLDPAVVQAVFFIYATIGVSLNFIADLIYGVFDPRIRVGTRK
jgi:peptide/nickel transport system permease protein